MVSMAILCEKISDWYDSAEYDEKEKAIVMRPLELAQEFRI